jgi:hypothetical protein
MGFTEVDATAMIVNIGQRDGKQMPPHLCAELLGDASAKPVSSAYDRGLMALLAFQRRSRRRSSTQAPGSVGNGFAQTPALNLVEGRCT